MAKDEFGGTPVKTDQFGGYLVDGQPQDKPSGFVRRAGDTALSLAKGIIGAPEAAVGLADLVTGGQAGKLVESAGVRFKDAKSALDEYLSPEQQAANKEVQDAKGFFPTIGAMVSNPSTILNSAVESAPSMLVGGAASRGAMSLGLGAADRYAISQLPKAERLGAVSALSKVNPIAAGAIGEGAASAGQNAEQVRQEDPNGTLTAQQSAILAASGALTGAIGFGAGKVANQLGIGEAATMMATGKLGPVGKEAQAVAANKGFFRKVGEGFANEGILQELPQSYQEQVAQNIAQGKPWDEGAAAAGAAGLLAGGAMGIGANIIGGHGEAPAPAPPPIAPGTAPTNQNNAAGFNPLNSPAVFNFRSAQPPATPSQTPSQAMGIDRAAGTLSDAAGLAVDTGIAKAPRPSVVIDPTTGEITNASTSTTVPDISAGTNGGGINNAAPSVAPGMGFGAAAKSAVDAGNVGAEPAGSAVSLRPAEPAAVAPGEKSLETVSSENVIPVTKSSAETPVTKAVDVKNTPPVAVTKTEAAPVEAPKAAPTVAAAAVPAGAEAGAGGVEAAGLVAADRDKDAQYIASAVANADRLGLTDQKSRKDSILNDLSIAFGVPKDEMTNDPAVLAALRVKPSLAAKEKNAERFVEGVKRQALAANLKMQQDNKVAPPSGNTALSNSDPVLDSNSGVQAESQISPTVNIKDAVGFQPNQGKNSEPQTNKAEPVKPQQQERPAAAGVDAAGKTDSAVQAPSISQDAAGTEQSINPVDIKAAAAKLIPNMSNAEVLALKDHYGPDHKRGPKIAAEIDKRGLNQGLAPVATEAIASSAPIPNKIKQGHDAFLKRRSDYFTPGNIVKSYGGHDEVVSYTPAADGKPWSVDVRAVVKQGDQWVTDPKDNRIRRHTTEPGAAEIAKGPTKSVPVVTAPQANEQAQATNPVSVEVGQDNQPISEGGKAFKTHAEAKAAKKLQSDMRIKRIDGGKYVLVEKTAAQLAAEKEGAKRLSNPQTSEPGMPIPAHAFIANEGGLNADTYADMNVGSNPTIGNRRLFAGGGRGLTMEQATERLIEEGYLGEGAGQNEAMALIKRSMTQPQYTSDGIERIAQMDQDARFEAYQAETDNAIAELEALNESQLSEINSNNDVDIDAGSNTSLEAGMRSMGFTEQEIQDAIAEESARATGNSTGNGGVDEAQASRPAQSDSGREGAPGDVQGQGAGLTSPTQAEVLAQQERAKAGEKANASQRQAEQERLRLAAERKDIAKASEAAAASFTLGGDAEQNLSGQGGMFDAPAAAPAVSANTIFTKDAADAARARLKAKLGRLNSGIDPETLMDGITLAGYHIENGARTFAAYAKAMLDDLGDGVKPYLKSWYMGVKFDPRATEFKGMDSASYVEDFKEEKFGQDIPVGNWWQAISNRQHGEILAQLGIGNQSPDTSFNQLRQENRDKVQAYYESLDGQKVAPPAAEPLAQSPAIQNQDQDTVEKSVPGSAPGTEFHLIKKRRGYTVAIMDTDTGEYMPVLRAFSGPNALQDATKYFDDVMATTKAEKESTTSQTLSDFLSDAISRGDMPKDNPALKKLVEAFDGKPVSILRMKDAQEALESGISKRAREIVAEGKSVSETYDALLALYASQPNLNIRTSTSINNQAYSTPAPLAFLASELADVTSKTSLYEPTAGNGMLTIGADPKNVTVNELDPKRLDSLKTFGFREVLQGDALKAEVAPKSQDRVMTNPPFGSVKDAKGSPTKVLVDGFKIGQIDHLIAARALETMKDDGKATLILGANQVAGGLSTNDRIFFNWLYSHYNVTGHFEVNGDLYSRQGAGWPVRVISIDGRVDSKSFSPIAGTIQRVDTWKDVYDQFNQIIQRAGQPASGIVATDGGRPQSPVSAPGAIGQGRPNGSPASLGNVAGTPAGNVPNQQKPNGTGVAPIRDEQRLNAQSDVPAGNRPAAPGNNPEPTGDRRPSKPAGTTAVTAPPEVSGNEFQVPYSPRSARKDEGVLIPSNMADPLKAAMSRLEDEVGDIDEYARKELGYGTVDKLHDSLMGLQVDSVTMAIYQMKQDKAVVIADQTGIGKGRQAAAIIRWAQRSGYTPVFISVKPSLFTDMYGDLADIGTSNINPFVMNKDAWVTAPDGSKLFANKALQHGAAIEKIASSGELPAGRNAVFMTYSQINKANKQRNALTALAPNAVFILDESHNAAGQSATGQFMIDTLGLAKGVTYLSATYAKRPDNMPLYFKTDIGAAAADTDGLAQAMASGGLPLQTVVSNNLVKAGQMFRRERSYNGVSIESKTDIAKQAKHEAMSDTATLALRSILEADRAFHAGFVKNLSDKLKEKGSAVKDIAGNQMSKGVEHTEFSTVVHNFIKQMLLGLKAQTAADEAIASLKRGEKPIIAVENTMGSFLKEYAESNGLKSGDPLNGYDYRTVLTRALARTRVIVETDPQGNDVKRDVPLSELDSDTRRKYDQAQSVIDNLKLDIPASPIDWMRAEITKAGYSIAEITGRKLSVDYTDPKKTRLSAIDALEQSDKVNTTRQFNSGKVDALILNVAGSTGISLHASEKFTDQRQRYMIVAQAAGDINVFMQMLGRIHRTGQVVLPKYAILSVALPTEKRPTAVLSGKMKSLNANTSSNTESATSVKTLDILNKYGDQIVHDFMTENMEMARELGVDSKIGSSPTDDIARMVTGRLALQPIAVQKAFYEQIESSYEDLINYLNKTNQNELEPKTFNFDAKETRQEVLFNGPDKNTPFGEDAIYGEYSIKAQGVAMTADEINAAMAENLDGQASRTHNENLVSKLTEQYNAYFKTLPEGTQQDTARQQMRNGKAFFADHAIGKTFRVDINTEPFNAVITNIRSTHKSTGNPFAMSKIQLTVSVNGALRSLSVPATQFRKIEVSAIGNNFSVAQLFKAQPLNERETAKIITGNLLAAYGEIQGTRGTIINFTKADNTIEQGILLPKVFNFKENTKGDYRLESAEKALTFLQNSEDKDIGRFGIMSRDGVLRVLPSGQGIKIVVPGSKLKGAKYFLDAELLKVTGDFASSGQASSVMVQNKGDALAALEILMKKQALYALPSMAEEAKALVGNPGDTPAFSRTTANTTRAADKQAEVQAHIDSITAKWANAPEVVVVRDMQDTALPEKIRQADAAALSNGAEGTPEGVFYKGTVYIVADQIKSRDQAFTVLAHEALGHFGLRGMFGASLDGIKQQIATMRAKEVLAKGLEYGLPMTTEAARAELGAGATTAEINQLVQKAKMYAAEEVLAEMAQTTPNIGFVQRAVAAIRTWLRQNVPSFKSLGLSDAEIIRSFILPARGFVVRGEQQQAAGGALAFSRSKEQYPRAGAVVDGRAVRDDVPNMSSIASSLDDYTILKGVREVPMSDFTLTGKSYSVSETNRIEKLANSIKESGEINPLIVVQDREGSYVLEGGHMAEALFKLGAKSFPAVVVRDNESLDKSTALDSGGAPMFSRSAAATLTRNVTDKLNETFNHPGKVSWWHNTIGSMYNLAERSKPFKRVFESAQSFINDTAYYATEAADMAPKIIPKLETISDIRKQPISFAENKAIGAPIFQGTLNWARDESGKPVLVEDLQTAAALLTNEQKGQRLLRSDKITENVLKMWQAMPIEQYSENIESSYEMNMLHPGVVWTDAELRNQFKLNDANIGLYREFRQAVDRSLENTAKAKMLSIGGKDTADLKTMVMDAPTAEDAAILLRDHYLQLANEQPERAKTMIASSSLMIDQADMVNQLKERGYAPLSRFGRYTVDVVTNGERKYFSLFESQADSNRMAEAMGREFGKENVAQGTLSQKEFELFQGVTPDSLELFGNMLGLESQGNEAKDQAFQKYIALTKNNNSAMKRLMRRKGVAGYSEDVGRVLAGFIYSNARQTSAGLNMSEMNEAITDIPKLQGELKDIAIKLADYVKNPQEEAQAIRGVMFAQYLGGSVASAFVNLTQPMAVSFPYLSQFGGAKQSAGALITAIKDMATKNFVYEKGLANALKIAEERGVVSPQEVHQLMAQARGNATLFGGDGTKLGEARAKTQNSLTKLALGWGKLFGLAEQVNRRSTFIAAYRIAIAQKIADPAGFAAKAVNETQFINNKGNKMQWGRGAVGATLMTFKSYSFNYLELLHRMATQSGPEGKKAAALMLGMLVLMAGTGGLPFEDDLTTLVDFVAQRMGYNFSGKQAKQEFLEGLFGKAGANFVDRGISGLPGSPIDSSQRMSMGHLVPGLGAILQKRDTTRDVMELIGPMGDMVTRAFSAGSQAINGDFTRAALTLSPKAIGNAAQGLDMANKGMYRDQKGFKVLDTTPTEAAFKAIGFQPASVSMIQESNYQNQRSKDFYSLHSADIRARWAKGIFENDPAEIQSAKNMMDSWNEKNPDQRINPNIMAVMKKVGEMRKTKDQRINDTAPLAMRAQLRKQSAEDRALIE